MSFSGYSSLKKYFFELCKTIVMRTHATDHRASQGYFASPRQWPKNGTPDEVQKFRV